MAGRLRALIIEDSDEEARLLTDALRQAGTVSVDHHRVATRDEFEAALAAGAWDVVISGLSLRQLDAQSALCALRDSGRDLPFIAVSPMFDEAVAISMMRAGAHDFVTKDTLQKLGPAVERELRAARLRANHHRQERDFQRRIELTELVVAISADFVNLAPDEVDLGIDRALGAIGLFTGVDRSYVFLFSGDPPQSMDNSHEWCVDGIEPKIDELKGLSVDDFPWWMGKLTGFQSIHIPNVDDLPAEAGAERRILEAQDIQSLIVVPMIHTGSLIGFAGFDSVGRALSWPDGTIALLQIVSNIIADALARREAELALVASERRYRELVEALNQVIFSVDRSGVIQFVSLAVERLVGYKPSELVGRPFMDLVHSEDRESTIEGFERLKDGLAGIAETRVISKSGELRWMQSSAVGVFEGQTFVGVRGSLTDITERRGRRHASG